MNSYLVLVSFENYRMGQIVLRTNEPGDLTWKGLERSGYVKQLPFGPEAEAALDRVDKFLDDPSTGIKLEPRRRKSKEADSGADPAEPGPGPQDSPE